MAHRPTVLIVHCDRSVVARARGLLTRGGFRVTGEVRSTASALALARLDRPAVVVLGDDVPGDVRGAVARLGRLGPARVVVLTDDPEHPVAVDLVLGGAAGLVPLDDLDTLPLCLHAVLRGEVAIPRRLVGLLLEEHRLRQAAESRTARPARLTAREAEILELLRRGHPTREIADHLGVEPVTVRSHIAGARRKLRVLSRDEAVEMVGASSMPASSTALGGA